jgi:hypothetical protein
LHSNPALQPQTSDNADGTKIQPEPTWSGIASPAEGGNAAAAAPAEAQTAAVPQSSTAFETEYGGVFFLLTLALYLHIYGDFTNPAKPGLELNIWDFLALLGSELTEGEMEKDPIWNQLAALAGRAPLTRPGSDFDPPDEWRLSPAWLESFPETCDAQPLLVNGRLISEHPAGFIVLDIPAEENLPEGKRDIMPKADRLQRWVRWMSSYVRARLVRALRRDDAVQFVCGRPGRVVFTFTHVDVTFSLDRHPIELRIAGLDRNIGWIPASGRYVAFHFQ